MKCEICKYGQWTITERKTGYTYKCNLCSAVGFIPANYPIHIEEMRKEVERQKYEEKKNDSKI